MSNIENNFHSVPKIILVAEYLLTRRLRGFFIYSLLFENGKI